MVAALEAIACRGVAWLIRKGSGDPNSILARPLDFGALVLTLAAIMPAYNSPATMLAVAVSSVLLIGCFPTRNWLYGTFLAVGSAVLFQWLSGYSRDGLIPFVMLGAFGAWGVGVALQRNGPRLIAWLGLPDLDLDEPPARVAVVLGVLAAALRGYSILEARGSWTGSPWLPWALAVLCLLMLRFDTNRGWVHAAVGLTGLGFAATLAPIVEPRSWWLSVLMALASVWSVAAQGAARVEGPFRRRLGIAEGDDSDLIDRWAFGAFALAGTAVAWIVIATTFGGKVAYGSTGVGDWSDILLTLGLAGLFVALEGRPLGRDAILIGFEGIAVLAVWWLGAPASPLLERFAIDRSAYLPLATAAVALAVVVLGERIGSGSRNDLADPTEEVGRLGLPA